MKQVVIAGAGPAGSSAALAALSQGAAVQLVERSNFPRHKVCGEFLSPEIRPALESLGLLDAFLTLRPAQVRRMELHVGRAVKRARLPEPAFGLSRYAFDGLLFRSAQSQGAGVVKAGDPDVIATGRGSRTGRDRLFGFKAHFSGPADDAVELYFFDGCYVGLNCIEDGLTNVCGLAPEHELRRLQFHIDDLVDRNPGLRYRLRPLRRTMNWMHVGPLDFRQNWPREDVYLAGDALSFVDPFTGSGLLCALLSGSAAGRHAATGVPIPEHILHCRRALAKPFAISSALRRTASTQWAEWLLPLIPAGLLFRLTRPAY